MRQAFRAMAFLVAATAATLAHADDAWVQIEARPTLAEAQERAQAYAGAFDNVQGYKLSSGWYGIVLGPFSPEEAARQLDLLKGERLIPADSFLATDNRLGSRFWPAGIDATTSDPTTTDPSATDPTATAPATDPNSTELIVPAPATDPAPTDVAPADPATTETATASAAPAPEPAPTDLFSDTEGPEEARFSESLLTADERMDLQRAMQFAGVYQGKIDGSFGKGTRASMAEWQRQQGLQPTGILTTVQRKALVDGWTAERTALGLQPVSETEAGIDIDLPLGLVSFKGYEPPFVHYEAKDGSGYQVLLISRQGDAKTLVALVDRLQALAVMPMGAERSLKKSSFTLTAANDQSGAYAQADLSGGLIKGFVLIWPKTEEDRAGRVLDAMKATFVPKGDVALDEDLGEPSATSASDLMSGLEVRKPAISRTGTYVSADGAVLTTTEVLDSCTRITLDGRYDAALAFRDDTLGIAVLKPVTALAPRGVATLETAIPRPDTDVALAGYSYGEALSGPVVTFGNFAEAKGLMGEPNLVRLAVTTLPGDSGAAVLDASGAMLGMLLPRKEDATHDLPKDVSFAASGPAIATALAANGITLAPAAATGSLAAEDLSERARAMTALVSCWK
jgi:peptidoglycan hydrolase-like protein with peptidoglycan-binding domain